MVCHCNCNFLYTLYVEFVCISYDTQSNAGNTIAHSFHFAYAFTATSCSHVTAWSSGARAAQRFWKWGTTYKFASGASEKKDPPPLAYLGAPNDYNSGCVTIMAVARLFVPWTFRSMDFSYHPWTFRTVVRILHVLKLLKRISKRAITLVHPLYECLNY